MVGNNFRLNIHLRELSSCLVQRAKSCKLWLLLSSFWEFVLPLLSSVRELAEFFGQYIFFLYLIVL